MEFHGLFRLPISGWEGTEVFGSHVIELTDWTIDVYQTLKGTRNTTYAYEGTEHAHQIAKFKQDQMHMEEFYDVIELGFRKLTSSLLGSPITNQYFREASSDELEAYRIIGVSRC